MVTLKPISSVWVGSVLIGSVIAIFTVGDSLTIYVSDTDASDGGMIICPALPD